ncbi:MAG: hexose kinase [Rhodospirillaceae bacterium]|nr:hexose kinase [Rhodospirillaceae bacterium]
MQLAHPVATLTLNPSADISVEVDSWQPGEKLRAEVMRWDPGGGGLNVARVMRALGLDSLAIHTAGGPEGARLNHALDRAGMHHRAIAIEGVTRISILIADRGTGQRYTLTFPGPTLSPDECAASLAAVSASGVNRGVLIASGSLPPGAPVDFYAEAARLIDNGGGHFVLDTSGRALKPALGERIFLAKLNQAELEDLAGHPLGDRDGVAAYARELLSRRRLSFLAITLGAAGAMLVSATETHFTPSPRVEARSAVGAGDSFLAAIMVGLFNREPLERVLRFAVCAGAAAISGEGTGLVDPNRARDILRGFERQLGIGEAAARGTGDLEV